MKRLIPLLVIAVAVPAVLTGCAPTTVAANPTTPVVLNIATTPQVIQPGAAATDVAPPAHVLQPLEPARAPAHHVPAANHEKAAK